eukprot:TRINITY_DN26831_c0_g1_i1.p1 TRINITY_DN26831_c0_g1~~TRINITY_DN26831_c0_g1_i1.p1  ORF type:complete len:362 (+),score=24.60 TRINITY_DN26831_c0_g1_i1:27-1088(+)
MASPLLSNPILNHKPPPPSRNPKSLSRFLALRCNHRHQLLRSNSSRIPPLKPYTPVNFSESQAKPLGFPFFRAKSINGDGESESVVDEVEKEARGESTMPSRFRYLMKEAPDRPVRWPWLIVLVFLVYAWRTVAWELTNWKKGLLAIARFLGYILKLAFAIIYQHIGGPITALIRYTEFSFYFIRSIYSSIVSSAPVPELAVIIVLTSTVLAIAEATVPDSVNDQPYILTLAGLIGFGAVRGYVSEPLFWLSLLGMFCFSRFVKKRDGVSSALPVAAMFASVGEPWVRALVIGLYLALAIVQHSKSPERNSGKEAPVNRNRRVPVPLLFASLAIGIHVAAKWAGYRHLTWMIV